VKENYFCRSCPLFIKNSKITDTIKIILQIISYTDKKRIEKPEQKL